MARRLATVAITPMDIYDVFALTLLGRSDLGEDTPLARFEADRLREKFLAAFMPLLRYQIEKYLSRPDRHDPEQVEWLETAPTAAPAELARMFDTATFRSERHRAEAPEDVYNARWAEIARAIDRLQGKRGLDVVFELGGPGGLLNLVHNTMTSVLDKLPDWQGLLDALNMCHGGTPADVRAGANPDIKRLLRRNILEELA